MVVNKDLICSSQFSGADRNENKDAGQVASVANKQLRIIRAVSFDESTERDTRQKGYLT